MILLPTPTTFLKRAHSRTAWKPRALDLPSPLQTESRLNPECSVSSFRSFALQSHVHADDITAEEAVRLMLAFYTQVTAPEGLLEDRGDVLHFEWGLYQCGEAELFHFELNREFTEKWKGDDNGVSRFTLGLHYRPTFTLRALKPGDAWCCSRAEIQDFGRRMLSDEVYRAIECLPPAEVALEWNPL